MVESLGARVRRRRNASTIAVTGAATPLGSACVQLRREDPTGPTVVPIDPPSGAALDGVDTVVHLAVDRSAATPSEARRAINVSATDALLDAAVAAGVRRVVLLTSAMVYGAQPGNAVPLDEDAPLMTGWPGGLVGEWLAMERAGQDRRGAVFV